MRLLDTEQQLVEVAERLEQQDVGAAFEEALDLLAEGVAHDLSHGDARGRGRVPRGARSTRPRARPSCPATSRASRASCAARRLIRPARSARPYGARRKPVGAERVRLDRVRAGLDVLTVDRADQLRLRLDEAVERRALRHSPAEQQRAHRAVKQQRGTRQPLGEGAPHVRSGLVGHAHKRTLSRRRRSSKLSHAVRSESDRCVEPTEYVSTRLNMCRSD